MNAPDYLTVVSFRDEVPHSPFGYPLTADRDGWIAKRLANCAAILEVGAGRRPFLANLKSAGFNGTFKTMDVGSVPADYSSLDGIREQFDGVIMREVVEHLPRQTFYAYLEGLRSGLLVADGRLAITTPNTWAPQHVLADYTHISPWPPHDMYAILRYFGFRRVEIIRVVWPSRFFALKRMYWFVHSRLYTVDYAGSYIAFASS